MVVDRIRCQLTTFLILLATIYLVGCGEVNEVGRLEALHSQFYLAPNQPLQKPEFTVVNRGKTSVRILDISSSCGCAAPELSATTVAPGESLTFQVSMIRPPVGVNNATIVLHTDSTAKRDVELQATIAAAGNESAAIMHVSHQSVYLVRDPSEQGANSSQLPESRRVEIVTIEPESEEFVTELRSSIPNVSVVRESVKQSKPLFQSAFVQRRYVFDVSIAKDAPTGKNSGVLACCTKNSPDGSSNSQIKLDTDVKSHLNCLPESLYAEFGLSGNLPDWYVTLSGDGLADVGERIEIAPTVSWLAASILPSNDISSTRQLRVHVKVVERPVEGISNAIIQIRRGNREVISMPVSVNYSSTN